MLTNVPEVEGVQKLWTDAYLKRAFGNKPQHLLRSKSNHFMYWCVQQCHPRPLPRTLPTSSTYLSLSLTCSGAILSLSPPTSTSLSLSLTSRLRFPVCLFVSRFWLLLTHATRHPPPAVGLASFKVKEAVEEKQQPGLCAAFRARGGVVCPIPERERCGDAQGTAVCGASQHHVRKDHPSPQYSSARVTSRRYLAPAGVLFRVLSFIISFCFLLTCA